MPSSFAATDLVLDHESVLDRVGGDVELLREISDIFMSEAPELVSEIRTAIQAEDARKLERSAHTLKGAVANFGALGVAETAYRLESMGRSRRLDGADEAFRTLESQLGRFQPALARLLAAVGCGGSSAAA